MNGASQSVAFSSLPHSAVITYSLTVSARGYLSLPASYYGMILTVGTYIYDTIKLCSEVNKLVFAFYIMYQ